MLGWFVHGRVTIAAAIVAAAVGAGGTALALGTSPPPHVTSMPTAGRTQAALKITSGTPVLDITVARLDGTLLRVSTPDSAPVRPELSGSRLILLSLVGARSVPGHGSGSEYAVRVVLNSAITWTIDLAGGASQVLLSLPGGVPTQVVADGGAGYLSLDGQSLTGVAGGTALTTPGWATATSRFAIDATAGVSRLAVSRW